MKPRLLTILCATSALLCVATLALSVRSIDYDDWVGFSSGRRHWGAASELGYIHLVYTRDHRDFGSSDGWHWGSARRSYSGFRFLHFDVSAGDSFPLIDPPVAAPWWYEVSIEFPHWCIAVPLALGPLRWAWVWVWHRRRSQRRREQGLCMQCGYDLRASRERCPECGTEITVGVDV